MNRSIKRLLAHLASRDQTFFEFFGQMEKPGEHTHPFPVLQYGKAWRLINVDLRYGVVVEQEWVLRNRDGGKLACQGAPFHSADTVDDETVNG